MAQFQIPQFIEEEAKIVGPLTIKQFIYIAIAGGLSFALFYVFTFILWLLISIILLGSATALAFVKINGLSLPEVLTAGFSYLWKPRRYVWQRAMQQTTLDISDVEKIQTIRQNISISDKLKNIAVGVTTGKIFRGGGETPGQPAKERYQVVSYLTGEQKVAKRIDY